VAGTSVEVGAGGAGGGLQLLVTTRATSRAERTRARDGVTISKWGSIYSPECTPPVQFRTGSLESLPG
jgi:hypothetical protein